MTLQIRAVDGKRLDVEALLLGLQRRILPSDTPSDPRVGFWWVLYDGELPVGFAGMRRSYGYSHTMYLSRAGVLSSHRGRGLQKRLIRVRLAKARSLGWTHAITDTYNNPPSANSLINCGFKSYLPFSPWGGDGVAYWIRKL